MLETFSSFPVALAVRYRATLVLMAAIAAFALLNLVAVLIAAAVANWLPEHVVAAVVGVLAGRTILQHVPIVLLHRSSGSLFILFGISALLSLWW